jgi:hypothetical protein
MSHSTGEGSAQSAVGPPLLPVAIIHVALFSASLFVRPILAPGTSSLNPFGSPAAAFAFFAQHGDAARLIAFLQFGSAIPLVIFTAAIVNRFHVLGLRAAGEWIAFAGGIGSALALVVAGGWSWALAMPGALPLNAPPMLILVPFFAGGPAWSVFFGLLLLGVSIMGRASRTLPRWLTRAGILLGIIAELAALTLVTKFAAPCIPIARFLGFAWMIAVGASFK